MKHEVRKKKAKNTWNYFCKHQKKVAMSVLIWAVIILAAVLVQKYSVAKAYDRGHADGAAEAETAIYTQLAYEEQQRAAQTTPPPTLEDGTSYEQLKKESEYAAKVVYGVQDNTKAGKKNTVWCIINRVGDYRYASNVVDVCNQELQWMGYVESNPVIQSLYDLCYEELEYWHNGGILPMSTDFVFLGWSKNEITLRTDFEEKGNCHYWYESDWEAFEQAREANK